MLYIGEIAVPKWLVPWTKNLSNFLRLIRKIRFSAFVVVAQLPVTTPWLQVACIKWSYRQDPKHGHCPHPDLARVRDMGCDICEEAERCLKLLHSDLSASVAALDEETQAKLLCGLAAAVVSALLAPMRKAKLETRLEALAKAVAPVLRRAKNLFEEFGQANGNFMLPKFPALPAYIVDVWGESPIAAATGDGRLRPALIDYDEKQQPVNRRLVELVDIERRSVAIPWREWDSSAIVIERRRLAKAKASVWSILLALHEVSISLVPACLQMRRDSSGIGPASVVSEEFLEIGALRIP